MSIVEMQSHMSNEATITIDEARALVSDAALWPRVRDFLWDFAPQVHESWVEDFVLRRGAEMQSRRVKAWLLARLGVLPCFHAFPKDDWSRLLLLDGATLESIAKWLGALVCADELRRVTDGTTVRELKVALPGVYPEVFGYTMYFKGFNLSMSSGGNLRRDVELHGDGLGSGGVVSREGVAIISSVLSGLAESLVARLRLKLPKSLCASASLREAKSQMANVQTALAKLLKLKFPEAYSLCC